jgi:Tfp pilus assembly protein PilN
MAAQTKTEPINLLPGQQLDTTSGRVVSWLLSTFRIIVIFTEFIVVAAFISRFFLDASSNDLTDKIESKKEIISSFSKFEKEFKSTQRRLSIFSSLTSNDKKFTNIVQQISSLLPPDVAITDFTYSMGKFTLKANSISEQSIAQLISNLKSTNLFSKISVIDIDYRQSNAFISFTLDLTQKG